MNATAKSQIPASSKCARSTQTIDTFEVCTSAFMAVSVRTDGSPAAPQHTGPALFAVVERLIEDHERLTERFYARYQRAVKGGQNEVLVERECSTLYQAAVDDLLESAYARYGEAIVKFIDTHVSWDSGLVEGSLLGMAPKCAMSRGLRKSMY